APVCSGAEGRQLPGDRGRRAAACDVDPNGEDADYGGAIAGVRGELVLVHQRYAERGGGVLPDAAAGGLYRGGDVRSAHTYPVRLYEQPDDDCRGAAEPDDSGVQRHE